MTQHVFGRITIGIMKCEPGRFKVGRWILADNDNLRLRQVKLCHELKRFFIPESLF